MAKNGADILLMVNVGTEAMPQYLAVGSQRDFSREETTEEIDVSSKDGRAKRVIAGRYSSTISLEALYVPTDEGYLALRDAMRNGDLIKVRISDENTPTEEADALITSLSEEYPDQAEATVSCDLTIDGEWAEVGS
jgi:TP901-1 family phage major tail protein